MIRLPKLLALVLAACTLAACTTAIVAPINNEVNAANDQTKALLRQVQQGNGPTQKEHQAAVSYSNDLWLPTSREDDVKAKSKSQEVLHQRFSETWDVRTLSEVAERITLKTGIPVYVNSDTAPVSQNSVSTSTAQKAPTQQTGYNVLPSLQPGQIGASPYQASMIHLQYDGDLKGGLDYVAALFGVSWDWSGGKLNFFRYTTRTFKITALPGDTSLQANVSNQNGTGGGSGGSSGGASGSGGGSSVTTSGTATSTASVSYQGNIFNSIAAAVTSMTTRKENVVVMPSTSSITVTDTPQILDRVAAFIDDQNQSLSKQVTVNVKILSVTLNDSNEYGLNLAALYNSLNGNVNFGISNSFTTGTSDSNLTFKIPGIAGSGVPGNPAIKAFQGSQAILSAITQQGRIMSETSVSLPTLNNQAAPLQVGSVNGYLANATVNQVANVGSTGGLNPGSIQSGLSMNIIPNVIDHTHMLLQYDIHISSAPTFTTATSAGASIQIPNYTTQNFLQRVSVDSGDTLVVAGFEQNTRSGTSQGVGDPNNVALGGGVDTNKGRTVMVILIQPIVGENAAR